MTADTSALHNTKAATVNSKYSAEAATRITESEYLAIVESRKSYRAHLMPKRKGFEWVTDWFTRSPTERLTRASSEEG